MASATSEVYVKLANGRTVTLNVFPGDTVQKMIAGVAKETNIPEKTLKLKYQGKCLNPAHTVSYLGVRVETILKAEIIIVKSITIQVQVPSGDIISIETQNISSIGEVKSKIEERAGIPKIKQVLKSGRWVLGNDNQSASDAGLNDGCLLTLEEPKPDSGGNSNPKDKKDDEAAKNAVMGTFEAAGKNVEIVFSFDTTGSMYACLQEVRNKLRHACNRLLQDIPNLRIGLIAHGDYCDHNGNYVIRMVDLTRDVDALVEFAQNVPSTGGGDEPECYEWVLHKAQRLEWAEDSAKALVVIGDSLPHSVNYTDQHINWHDELDILKGMGIKVYGVQALDRASATPFYQQLSEHTGGAHIKFSNFDVITDMFLAVCYREADDGEGEQLAAFLEEVQVEGRMEGEVRAVLQQVAQAPQVEPGNNNRYVSAAWWDPSLDTSFPGYTYNSETDTWSNMTTSRRNTTLASPDSSHSTVESTTPPRSKSFIRGSKISRSFRKLRSHGGEGSKNKCSLM